MLTAHAELEVGLRPAPALGAGNAWWNGVDAGYLANVKGRFHPGAARYYKEAGMALPAGAE